MDFLFPSLLYYFFAPVICFYFFCRCCSVKGKWYLGMVYAGLSFGLAYLSEAIAIQGILFVFLEIILLSLFGLALIRCVTIQIFTVSALTIAVLCVSTGIAQSLEYFAAENLKPDSLMVLQYIHVGANIITILLLIFSFHFIIKTFHSGMRVLQNSTSLLLGLPVLFISLVEKTLSAAVYGNTVIWDTQKGLVFPLVNNLEMFALQIFACGGLFASLVAFQKINILIQNKQTIKLLEQQTHEQEIYLQEAQSRYEQTRAFRHDLKNHLLVLGELLKENNAKEAYIYLSNLEQMSNSLSFPCCTGNIIADALLGSKLAVAKQKEITVDCSVKLPKSSAVKDIDWCIVLANALDNAINASGLVPAENRFIRIIGKQKGSFYLLCVENRCEKTTKVPEDGIGLSNIKAIVRKYEGTADIEINDGVFKLNMLFVISQQ